MVVESDHSNLILVEQVLLKSGDYVISTFENAYKALESLSENLPDLVISALMMPGINGIEFCKQLKNDNRFSSIPFIILSAENDRKNLIAGLEAGAIDYIPKPFNINTFLPKISNILRQAKRKEDPFSVLIVDPSPMFLNVTKHKLLKAGFSVTIARTAEKAIERVHTKIYNLIISSIELSGMDGLKFCKHLKESVFKEIPFVIFSGKISENLLKNGLAVGVNDFWEKTISPSGLLAKVNAISRQYDASMYIKIGLKGNLSDMQVMELVQMIGMNKKSGILSIVGNNQEGHIHFNGGEVTNASTLMYDGEPAFLSLMTLGIQGKFYFLPTGNETDTVITKGSFELLMEGAKLLDDIGRIKEEVIQLTGKKIDGLEKTEAAFLSYVDGKTTFAKLIESTNVEPYHGFEILTKLINEDIVKSP